MPAIPCRDGLGFRSIEFAYCCNKFLKSSLPWRCYYLLPQTPLVTPNKPYARSWEESSHREIELVYKNPRATLQFCSPLLWGCCTSRKNHTTCQLFCSNPHQAPARCEEWAGELTPIPSLQEGVGIFYLAACAATRLIHYTPPPFDDAIVPEDFNGCQAFAENS